MGSGRLRAGTVDGAMAPLAEPAPTSRPRRRVDARTIGICVCAAVIAALVAGLVANAIVGDDGGGSNKDHLDLASSRIDGRKLLAVSIKTRSGGRTTLADQVGDKPVLVNLWAQSYRPCVDEMPRLEQLHKSDARVDVIGVDTQDQPNLAAQMAKQTGITYPWLLDPKGNLLYQSKAVGLPRSVLLTPSGKVL